MQITKQTEKASEQTKGLETQLLTFASGRAHHQEKQEPIKEDNERARILVMDDDRLVGQVAVKMLTHLGYHAEVAVDGSETINLYKKSLEMNRPYDVVIMDLTIHGGMGGAEAIKKLLIVDPQVKAIVTSGYSSDPIMANFQQYGFRGFIMKPYILMELKKTLAQVLDDH